MNVTESTDPSKWPDVHLTFTVCLSGLQEAPPGTISRFDDRTGQWVANLNTCLTPIKPPDTDLGCVHSISFEDGMWTLVVWASKNGHLAK